MTNPNSVLIVSLTSVGITVIIVIGALAIWGSESNPIIATAIGSIGTALLAIIGALVVFRVGSEAKAAAVEAKVAAVEAAAVAKVAVVEGRQSKEASKENAQSIAALAEQTSHSLDGVNQKVDGHLGGLMEKIEALTQQVARLEKDKAVTKVETDHKIAEATAATPPGMTPAHGTPVGPEGKTTIVIDPASAATIIESTAGKKGAARVGDKS